MENKIQELTDKIYREGVEKGNEEAQKLIAKAQEEAKRIIEDAHKEADSIVATAHKSADELAENTKSELKLFAGQELLYDLYYNINCVIFSHPIRFTPNLQKSIWYWIERKEEKFLLFQKKLILHQLCSVMITKEWQKKQKNTYATTHDRD